MEWNDGTMSYEKDEILELARNWNERNEWKRQEPSPAESLPPPPPPPVPKAKPKAKAEGFVAKSTKCRDFESRRGSRGEFCDVCILKYDDNGRQVIPSAAHTTFVTKTNSTKLSWPPKLMDMLTKEATRYQSRIVWLPEGNTFAINDSKRFTSDILLRYFGEDATMKISSQQLINYGYHNAKNRDQFELGPYSHVFFLRISRSHVCR